MHHGGSGTSSVVTQGLIGKNGVLISQDRAHLLSNRNIMRERRGARRKQINERKETSAAK